MRKGGQVVYLDFDGVLHPSEVYRRRPLGIHLSHSYVLAGHRLFEHTALLSELLAPHPDVSIVLSTSWVRVLGFARARGHLPPALAQRVVGATYHSAMKYGSAFEHMSRGQQVLADVGRREPRAWLALDDDDELWPVAHTQKLVVSDPDKGIGAPAVTVALQAALAHTFG